jgi:hypothetical protein
MQKTVEASYIVGHNSRMKGNLSDTEKSSDKNYDYYLLIIIIFSFLVTENANITCGFLLAFITAEKAISSYNLEFYLGWKYFCQGRRPCFSE